MTLDQFDKFAQLVLGNLSDYGKNEYYDTDQSIARDLLDHARDCIFAEYIAEQEEYRTYQRLKEKFEPKSDTRKMEPLKLYSGQRLEMTQDGRWKFSAKEAPDWEMNYDPNGGW